MIRVVFFFISRSKSGYHIRALRSGLSTLESFYNQVGSESSVDQSWLKEFANIRLHQE